MIFVAVKNLNELEKAGKWDEVVNLLQGEWNRQKDNLDILLRLATECWYIMSNWEFLNLDKSILNYEQLQEKLIKTYNCFRKYHKDNNKCLAIFGYMISLFPDYFYTDEDNDGRIFLEYEKTGKEMIRIAYTNEPKNELYKVLYYRSVKTSNKVLDNAKEELGVIIKELFPQNTEIEEYFKEVLTM